MIDTIAADLSAVASPLKPNSSSPLPIGDRLKGKDGAEFVLAAIDIGTNSIHMVVVSIDPSLPSFNIIGKEKDTVRLGDFCEATGDLTEEAMLRGINSLKRCLQVANSFNADDIVAVATSAVREAGNGQVFIERVKNDAGLSINLISGEEEARRIYLGVISSMELKGNSHAIVDIGGGSTEIILGRGGPHDFLSSSKVGAVRLTSRFITSDPLSKKEYDYLRAYVRGVLEPTVDSLKRKLTKTNDTQAPLKLIGTSGTIECLAILVAMGKTGVEPDPINGYRLTYDDLTKWLGRLRKMSYAERLELPGMSERRAEIIVAGAVILHEAMKLLGADSFQVCERSLREGVIVDWMLTQGLIEDRLRYQKSIRKRSIHHLAHKFHVDNPHEERVACLALNLFDQTHGTLHNWDDNHRELLWAAGMLHNCGHFVRHSAHHKHSYYLIRHGGLLGFTEVDIELIANIARYHRKSPPKKKHEPYRHLPSDRHRRIVDQLSAILRIAVALDRRQLGAIKAIQCRYEKPDKELVLSLHANFPGDECNLEQWSLNEKKTCFESAFGVTVTPQLKTVSLVSES